MHETLVRPSYSRSNAVREANREVALKRRKLSSPYACSHIEKLITCANCLTDPYVYLPFHRFVCLNIDLEAQSGLESRLTHLHAPAGDQPLVMETSRPAPQNQPWPRISVVVCCDHGAHTIRDTLDGLQCLDYPAYEVIVVDDGSTDATASIVQASGFRLIRAENRGLSNMRNAGLQAAQGEIVAYIDDDAYPEPQWLTHLATTFLDTSHAGVGGPHLAYDRDGWLADCVSSAPGGPVHVLLCD